MDYPNYSNGVSQPFVPKTYDKVQEIGVLENIERRSNMHKFLDEILRTDQVLYHKLVDLVETLNRYEVDDRVLAELS